jgi:deoxycytidylate deaminase
MEQGSLLPSQDLKSGAGTDQAFALDYPETELVFGLVYAVGTDYKPVLDFLKDQIKLGGYAVSELHISDWFPESAERLGLPLEVAAEPEIARIVSNIEAGNKIRSATERPDVFALLAAAKISSARSVDANDNPIAQNRTAHLLASLKRPEEVESLRKIYGPGFFLIGIFSDEAERITYLTDRKGLDLPDATKLVDRDQREKEVASGQRTRDTFELADVFVELANRQYEQGLRRFLKLVFGDPNSTPTGDEHSMFLAYAASLRSGDLARQVGAALACAEGDVIALGCNDVPAPGGGLYSYDDGELDQRDYRLKKDHNDARKEEIIDDVIRAFQKEFLPKSNEEDLLEKARPILRKTLVAEVTEYGRSVHAEMDALIAAGRNGVSFRNATLYTTTFPCHTCTRHIIAAGVKRVVYIEPYPKSLAPKLHEDAIRLIRYAEDKDFRIPFEPFVGIGPRRFFDLFSLKLSSGNVIERKIDGKMVDWDYRRDARPRVPMPPTSYLEREELIQKTLNAVFIEAKRKIEDDATTTRTASEERSGVLEPTGADSYTARKLAKVEDRGASRADVRASGEPPR